MKRNQREVSDIKNDDRVVDDKVIQQMFWEISETPEWMNSAECVQYDVENPEDIIDPVDDADFIAKNLCPLCSVKDMCKLWGNRFDIRRGIYAGVIYSNKETTE